MPRDHQIDWAGSGGEPSADVDVAVEAIGDALDAVAGEVVDLERALLVVADHDRLCRIGFVVPDGRIVGGVPGFEHWVGLDDCLGVSRWLVDRCGLPDGRGRSE